MLLPRHCPLCGAVASEPCLPCRRSLPAAGPLDPPIGVDRCWAALRYEGSVRGLIGGLKYRNRRSAVPWLAGEMADLVDGDVDLVTWIPSRPSQRGRRGFDQGEVLARRVALCLGAPARALLVRRGGVPQTGRSAAQRRVGPDLRPRRTGARHVLLVDDVVTTGASLQRGAIALRSVGVRRIDAVVAGATPLKYGVLAADS